MASQRSYLGITGNAPKALLSWEMEFFCFFGVIVTASLSKSLYLYSECNLFTNQRQKTPKKEEELKSGLSISKDIGTMLLVLFI